MRSVPRATLPFPPFPRVILLCAGLLLLLGISTIAIAGRAPSSAAPHSPAADTAIIFGPKQFSAAPGTAMHVEQFTEMYDAGAVYVLEVTNGASSGANRVTDATVKLNGVVVLAPAEFQSTATVLTREIWIADGANTLQVNAKGDATRYLSARVLRIRRSGAPLYRRGFQKSTDEMVAIVDTFATGSSANKPGRLVIDDGATDDRVYLNGHRIFPSCIPSLGTDCPAVIEHRFDVTLQPVNEIRVELNGPAPSTLLLHVVPVDTAAPVLQLSGPAEGLFTNATSVVVAGTALDETPPVALVINGDTVPVASSGAFSKTVQLASEGENLIQISAQDAAKPDDFYVIDPDEPTGHRVEMVRRVIRDTRAPVLALAAPAGDAVTKEPAVEVRGSVTDAMAVTVNVNGTPLALDASGSFGGSVSLVEGVNFVTVTATDQAGNSTSDTRQITLDTQAPTITLTAPAEGQETQLDTIAVQGSVADLAPPTVTVNGVGVSVSLTGTFAHAVALQPGANTITVTATDKLGNAATVARSVTRRQDDVRVPPDPATVAPRPDRAVATNVADGTAFLYTGPNPIQTGVAPGIIRRATAGVVRGRVISRQGAALPGVTVTVRGHPEFGQTLSRADGMYDLAVNGGQALTLDFERPGYLSAQRQATVPWQGYAITEDLALLAADPAVTRVELTASTTEMQVARGSVMQDKDGRRQATLLFAPGTEAVMVMADGTARPLASGSVRVTEATVGPYGRASMPGPLPPGVAYTYAADFSMDEARALDAKSVRFTRPVAMYLDNFLNFPVGVRVPAAFYDPERTAWQPEDDAVVLRILAPVDGVAQIDVDGDGNADADTTLLALGMTAAERTRLAQLYTAGTTLWRGEMGHFSWWDWNPILNWIFGRDDDASNVTNGAAPDPDEPDTDQREDDKTCQDGSIIDCTNQALGETIGVRGTPVSLHYWSNQTPGYLAGRTISIPLIGRSAKPLAGTQIQIRVKLAGRQFADSMAAAPGAVYHFVWDGKDAYGRPVQGRQGLEYAVGYVYPQYYTLHTRSCTVVWRSWGRDLSCSNSSQRVREDDVRWTFRSLGVESVKVPEVWDARGQGWGGWTVGIHHVYDPAGQLLRMGTGERTSASSVNGEIANVVGNGFECGDDPNGAPNCGDGRPASEATLEWPKDMAVAADGSIYVADWPIAAIRRVGPDGIIRPVAGNNTCGFSGDGGPALQAQICQPASVALGPDGSLYIADAANNRVRRVTPDGIIHTIAGNGNWAYSGDGGPATLAGMEPEEVVVAPDGRVYIADYSNHRVRRVDPDGRVVTVLGNGTCGTDGDGGRAIDARTCYPGSLALGPDGSLYVSNTNRVRRIDPGGTITLVVRSSMRCWQYEEATGDATCGDGKPAAEVPIAAEDIAVAADGSIYLVERNQYWVRRIGSDGIVNTVAGGGTVACGYDNFWYRQGMWGDPACGHRAAARQVSLSLPSGVAVGPDQKVYFADSWRSLVRRIDRPYPKSMDEAIDVPSKDGSEIFAFDRDGRHLHTRDALTGIRRWAFGYDAGGLLVRITDSNGLDTRVERGDGGTPVAVVGPYGDRTSLSVGADGYLRTVTDPARGSVRLSYHEGGLLASKQDVAGATHRFLYSSAGRLARDEGPDGNAQTVTRFATPYGAGGILTSPLGLTSRFTTERLPDGTVRSTTLEAAGRTVVTSTSADGVVRITSPNGTVTRLKERADPRFGTGAPVLADFELATPGGRKLTARAGSPVLRVDPNNPMVIQTSTDTSWVDGRVYVSATDVPARTGTAITPAGRTSAVRWDSAGRIVERREPGLAPERYRYDAFGRLKSVEQGDHISQFTYDDRGRLDVETSASGRVRRYSYGDGDRVSAVVEGGLTTQFRSDLGGRPSQITPPGRSPHTLRYDSAGRIRSYLPPGVAPDSAQRFSYDQDGRLREVVGLDGRATTLDYDTTGRLDRVVGNGREVRYTYEPNTGNVARVTTTDGVALNFTYDGTLPLRTEWSGDVGGSYSTGFDTRFSLASDSVNGASAVNYQYDQDGLLTSAGGLITMRDPATGQLTATELGAVRTSVAYDSVGGVRNWSATHEGREVYTVNYRYGPGGLVRGITETIGGEVNAFDFKNDSAGRLVEVRRNGAVVESYEFDDNGNRTRQISASEASVGTYDEQDRLVSSGTATYGYSAVGELRFQARGVDTTRYDYNGAGTLRSVTMPDGRVVQYVNDATGRRVGRKVNGRLVQGFVYSSPIRIAAELDSAGNVRSRFVYADQSNVPEYMVQGGRTYRLLTDHLGSVRLVVDAETGQTVQRVDYNSWGDMIRDTNPGFQPFGFAGGLYDPITRLTKFGVRDYDASVGRWNSKDPAGFLGGDTNLYAYVKNDPVNFVDSDGLDRNRPLPGGRPLPGVPGATYRMDFSEQPYPDMHIRWRDGSETLITNKGGWALDHGGKPTVPPPAGARADLRKLVNEFLDEVRRRGLDGGEPRRGGAGGGIKGLGVVGMAGDLANFYCAQLHADKLGISVWLYMTLQMQGYSPQEIEDGYIA